MNLSNARIYRFHDRHSVSIPLYSDQQTAELLHAMKCIRGLTSH
jgi:hypothetical protein